MTTEEDFQGSLDANAGDWQTRLVFADWLEERSDPRADGYRALGALRMYTRENTDFWWCNGAVYTARPAHENLPSDWFRELEALIRSASDRKLFVCWATAAGLWYTFRSRQLSDDFAALAFAQLPAERRAELLARTAAD